MRDVNWIRIICGLEIGLGDFKANHSQADLYKAVRGLATYSWSKLDLYEHWIDFQNTFTVGGGGGVGMGWIKRK